MFAASRPCIAKPFAPSPTGAFLFPIPALRLRASFAHYKDKAVFIYLTSDGFERVDMATAPCFRSQKK